MYNLSCWFIYILTFNTIGVIWETCNHAQAEFNATKEMSSLTKYNLFFVFFLCTISFFLWQIAQSVKMLLHCGSLWWLKKQQCDSPSGMR